MNVLQPTKFFPTPLIYEPSLQLSAGAMSLLAMEPGLAAVATTIAIISVAG